MSRLHLRTETAFATYLAAHASVIAQNLHGKITTGADDDERQVDGIVCHATGSDEDNPLQFLGNQFHIVTVTLRTSADRSDPNNTAEDRRAVHLAYAEAIDTALVVDTLAAELNPLVANWTVFHPIILQDHDTVMDDRNFVSTWTFRCYVVGVEVADA